MPLIHPSPTVAEQTLTIWQTSKWSMPSKVRSSSLAIERRVSNIYSAVDMLMNDPDLFKQFARPRAEGSPAVVCNKTGSSDPIETLTTVICNKSGSSDRLETSTISSTEEERSPVSKRGAKRTRRARERSPSSYYTARCVIL
jgi:hypothetical protein